MILTNEHCNALVAILDGADVYSIRLAKALREIQRRAPHLVSIVPAKNAPRNGAARPPYFGAIATPSGRQVLVELRHTVRTCSTCGCTQTRACQGGCSWIDFDLCSRCAGVEQIQRSA